MTRTVGYVAAGGRSVRMGRDKALLPWEGSTLLDHAIARLQRVCGEARILCGAVPRYQDRGLPLVLDRVADAGPLAGLEAALDDAAGSAVLLLGVDMPFVTPVILGFLRGCLQGEDAAVPVFAGRPEPLCAIYGPRCLEAVRRRLAAGERRMTCFWPDVSVRELDFRDLDQGDASPLFRNLNAPQDLEGAPTRDKRSRNP